MYFTRRPIYPFVLLALMIIAILAPIVITVGKNGDVTVSPDSGTMLGVRMPDGKTIMADKLVIKQEPLRQGSGDFGWARSQLPAPNPNDGCFDETGDLGSRRLSNLLTTDNSINIASHKMIWIRVIGESTWMATRMDTGNWWVVVNPILDNMPKKVLNWLQAQILSANGEEMTEGQVRSFFNDPECFPR